MLNGFPSAQRCSSTPTPSTHRLLRGLPGYLILFAPHDFAPQRQYRSRKPPSPPVFLLISTHSTAPPEIPLPSTGLKAHRFGRLHRLSRCLSRPTYVPAYAPFTPNNSGQRLPPTYYRGCWHVVSRGFLHRYRHIFFPMDRVLQPKGRHHSRGVAPSGLRPLRKIPYCCLP